MALLEHLQAPFPARESLRDRLLFTLGTGLFVALFLIFFQPFGTREWIAADKYLFLAGYGLVVFLGMLLFSVILPQLWARPFREENWTLGKHILFLWAAFSFCILACYLYKQWYFGLPIALADFGYFSLLSVSVAIFPITALVTIDYIRRLRQYQAGTGPVQASRDLGQTIRLEDEYGKEAFVAPLAAIRYIQSADNYAEIYYRQNDQLIRELIRHSLKALEEQLTGSPLVRCHRSYIVNLEQVERISGNAQGYRFHLSDTETTVPVARSRSELARELMTR